MMKFLRYKSCFFLLSVCAITVVPIAHAANGKRHYRTALNKRRSLKANPYLLFPLLGGVVQQLNADGIAPYANYTGQYANNPIGGLKRGDSYAQQLAFGAVINLAKIAGINDGKFFIGLNLRQGYSDSAYIGNELGVQSVYGSGEDLRIANLSYSQSLGNNFSGQIGFFPLGNKFAYTPLMLDFQNSGFYGHPLSLPFDSGWSDYPVAHWGADVNYKIGAGYIRVGLFDVNPTGIIHGNGFKLSLNGSTGVIVPFEYGIHVHLGRNRLSGEYKVGGYYDSSEVGNVVGGEPTRGRYGAYFLAEQELIKGSRKNIGAKAFAQITVNDARTSIITRYVDAGIILNHIFANRPRDYATIGFVRAEVNNRKLEYISGHDSLNLESSQMLDSGETVIEAGYNFAATPWLNVYPNIQYIINPRTFSFQNRQNAFVFGLSTKINLL